MRGHKNIPDIAELLNDTEACPIDDSSKPDFSEQEGAFLDRVLDSLDTENSSSSDQSFAIREIANPEACFAVMLPTAESVLVHLAGFYSTQFKKTWEVLNQYTHSELLEKARGTLGLDDVIAEYFKGMLENPQ